MLHFFHDDDPLDDIYQEMVYIRRYASEAPGGWVYLTHVKVIDDEQHDLDCCCGHPDCGAC